MIVAPVYVTLTNGVNFGCWVFASPRLGCVPGCASPAAAATSPSPTVTAQVYDANRINYCVSVS